MPLWTTLVPGYSVEECGARIDYSKSGVLTICDFYGCSSISVRPSIKVSPAPPILRPFTITDVVYIQFTHKIYVEPGMTLWARIPLDAEIRRGHRTIARITLSRAKYRLVGSLVEGVIARNHVSEAVISEDPPQHDNPCEALVKFEVTKGRDVVEGIPFNAGHSSIYADSQGRFYLSPVQVAIGETMLDTKLEANPPLSGLRLVRRPPYSTGARSITLGQPAVTVQKGWRLWPSYRF